MEQLDWWKWYVKMVPVTRWHRLRRVTTEWAQTRDKSPRVSMLDLGVYLSSSLIPFSENWPHVVMWANAGRLANGQLDHAGPSPISFPENWNWDGEVLTQAVLCAGHEETWIRQRRLTLWCEHVRCLRVSDWWKPGWMDGWTDGQG